ncbi:P-loop containing nucleoside triphosphate hydrolase protein [Aspergillus heteromorphus CBS 117.55]|uniref:P-loop containing nucleoside triphosphate hydrolase protein n=1 Tax=Aspergillus heteromorphus CBS 117.55 TaxID=1448321 RepID=A0A317VST3_9EURO|nr:P-loop containing nucleoside triphosphate hydrolase protein [Aspergillus heteromorphus CBS 117.55]PWY76975.1 P-loop containing nucleoside triphosphate hydrolase protein [Aspergillus heteromorphus CBS 117.55]
MSGKRLFSTCRVLRHENPLGLPRSGTPPSFPRRRGLPEKRKIRDVKKVVAVSSAKGGVGKSTIAVNLALAFARRGIRTGILDTDIFGPSIPTLLNLSGEPRLDENNLLLPLTNYNLKSIVSWGPLDILFLDLPPGTGDVQLTINQEIVVDGAVIVTTPQDIALRDAVRGIGMFQKMHVPVLGMVRNMAFFQCPGCGQRTEIFSNGYGSHKAGDWGVQAECRRLGVQFLGDVPLDARVCEDADRGVPSVVAEEGKVGVEGIRREAFLGIAERVAREVGVKW